MRIERNLNPAGKLSNAEFGFAEIIDGVIRLLSFGYYRTDATLQQSKRAFMKIKKMHEKMREGK